MISDIKSGIQLIIFLLFLAAIGYFLSQAMPAISQATTLPARIQQENAALADKVQLEHAESEARAAAAPRFVELELKAQQAKIDAMLIEANGKANAQVIAAQGQADKDRATGQALLNAVLFAAVLVAVGALVFFGVQWLRNRSAHVVIKKVIQDGGGIAFLPSGEIRVLPVPVPFETPRRPELCAGAVNRVQPEFAVAEKAAVE